MTDAFDKLIIETLKNAIYLLPYAGAQLEGMQIGFYTYLTVLLYFAGEIYLVFFKKGKVGSK
jgi:hypothetical protein